MKSLSIGKVRGLQQTSTPGGAFTICALDHRNNLRNALAPTSPDSVSVESMVAFKRQVVQALAPAASAVLLDPEIGGAQCIASGALPGRVGLVMAVEATGYTGAPAARQSQVLPGWSVAKARRMGASAVKLLVYYHPDSDSAGEIERLVAQVAEDCRLHDIAFFLEPLSYSLQSSEKKLPPAERRRVVIETARRLVSPGVDVLKAEFPLDIKAEPDERTWAEACAGLSQASRAPWILLSASVDFETYLRQVTVACQHGASGVAVGRAVWQEAPGLAGVERQAFLDQVARPRMSRLTALCEALARPWTDFYQPEQAGENWYLHYE
jgi:tagatose-1,6-bisphosphate aldolase